MARREGAGTLDVGVGEGGCHGVWGGECWWCEGELEVFELDEAERSEGGMALSGTECGESLVELGH